MPRKATFPPKIYVRRGKEYVRLRSGGAIQDVTLGHEGSSEARAEYARILAEIETTGHVAQPAAEITVAELADRHITWADARYDPRQAARVATALRPVVELYGHRPAVSFGPVALETVRARYVAAGYCRRLCNQMVDCVRLAWKRAAGQELIPHGSAQALYDLAAIHRRQKIGEVTPIDHPKIPPVPRELVERTRPHLGRIVADMVRLQLLTGARPGEVCALRPCDLARPWKEIEGVSMWLYRLDGHKTDWRGHQRWIPIGPAAQAVLAGYLDRQPEAYCFSAAEARAEWEAGKRALRKSRVQPSQVSRRKTQTEKRPGSRYTTQSYGRAIANACKRHGLEHWAPNQLRHEVLDRIETEYGQEDARCVGGHTTPTTTAVYARGVERAARVLAKIG